MRRLAALVCATVLVAGCGSAGPSGSALIPATPAPTATAAAPAPSGDFSAQFDIGGYSLYLNCRGAGSPTVVLEAGLGSSPFVWTSTQDALASTNQVCMYARAGLSPSPNRPRGIATKEGLSAGFMAGETYKLLKAAGVAGPYVVVGHSYGGMLVRLFAFAHADETAGVVLVDSSSEHQYEGAWLANEDDWFDGPTLVNRVASAAELNAITSLGSMPLIVLTQSELYGDFERDWSHFQDELATLSTNSLHMVAYPSGHSIMDDQGPLVIESIRAVLESAVAKAPLPPCAPRFSTIHALCLATTMTAQLDKWTAERAAIKPTAGDFPARSYLEIVTDAVFKAVTGTPAGFKRLEGTWSFANGKWSASVVVDGALPEKHEGVYSADGAVLTLVLPLDWKLPMTSGVYRLRWKADKDGTIHFEQIDDWSKEPDWTVPWVPVKGT